MDTWLQYLIIGIVLFLICLIVLKLTKRDFRIEANKLIGYLGGKDNIVSAECNMSRFKVILKENIITKYKKSDCTIIISKLIFYRREGDAVTN